jgi:translation elongation factor EF-Ts
MILHKFFCHLLLLNQSYVIVNDNSVNSQIQHTQTQATMDNAIFLYTTLTIGHCLFHT